ncbi:hypothetical protein ACFE04_017467 [Oxalis oulophora]
MADSNKYYITRQELQTHNKRHDLWISIQGKVYNITDWSKHHPGGQHPLLSFAGQDVTDAFIAYHPGTAWHYLDNFFNGYYLKDYNVSEVSKDYRKLVLEFSKLGLFDKKGHAVRLSLFAMASLFLLSVYCVFSYDSVWMCLLSGLLMGTLWTQSGWIGHDSGHYQVMNTPRMNKIVQILSGNCLAGVSIGWWKWNHNAHHIACNSLDFDPDLQHMPIFAVSSKLFNSLTSYFYDRKMVFDSAARVLVSYQHWTFYPVMCFARLNLFAQSFIFLFTKSNVKYRVHEIFGLVVFWIWFPLLVSCLPSWKGRILFVFASFLGTFIQHVQFCLNHFSSSVYVGRPIANNWFEMQTKGSLDITCSPWMDWFHGGLQFQIEHHLFPRLPRCQLRKVSPFVKELCKKHNLPYESVTFFMANMMTWKTLRDAALQARDICSPVPKNLVWEAVNTLG